MDKGQNSWNIWSLIWTQLLGEGDVTWRSTRIVGWFHQEFYWDWVDEKLFLSQWLGNFRLAGWWLQYLDLPSAAHHHFCWSNHKVPTWPSMSSQGGLESYWMRNRCFRNIFLMLFWTYSWMCKKLLCEKASACKSFSVQRLFRVKTSVCESFRV